MLLVRVRVVDVAVVGVVARLGGRNRGNEQGEGEDRGPHAGPDGPTLASVALGRQPDPLRAAGPQLPREVGVVGELARPALLALVVVLAGLGRYRGVGGAV